MKFIYGCIQMPTYKGTISLRFQIIWDRNQSSYWQTRCWIHYFSGFWGNGGGIWTSAMEVNGTYIWPDGTHVSGFHTNQPDGNGSCCQYWRGANALDDVNCSARLQFVCEMSFWMEWHINRIFLKIGQQWLVTICVTNWFWNTELPMMRKEGWGGPDPFYEDKPQFGQSNAGDSYSQLFTFIKGHKQLQNTSLFGPFLADYSKLDRAIRMRN